MATFKGKWLGKYSLHGAFGQEFVNDPTCFVFFGHVTHAIPKLGSPKSLLGMYPTSKLQVFSSSFQLHPGFVEFFGQALSPQSLGEEFFSPNKKRCLD